MPVFKYHILLVWYKFWFSVVFCTCVSCLIKWALCLLFSGQMALHSSEVIVWLGLHLVSHFLRGKYGPSNTLPLVWVYTNHKCHKGQWAMALYKWGYLEICLLVFYMNTYRNNKNLLSIKICILISCHRVWSHVYFQNKYVLWKQLIDIALSLFLTPLRFYWRLSEIASDTFAAWFICIIGAYPLCVLEITNNT